MWDVDLKTLCAVGANQLTFFTRLVGGSCRKPGTSSPGLTSFGKPDGWTIPTDPGGRSGDDGGRTPRAANDNEAGSKP